MRILVPDDERPGVHNAFESGTFDRSVLRRPVDLDQHRRDLLEDDPRDVRAVREAPVAYGQRFISGRLARWERLEHFRDSLLGRVAGLVRIGRGCIRSDAAPQRLFALRIEDVHHERSWLVLHRRSGSRAWAILPRPSSPSAVERLVQSVSGRCHVRHDHGLCFVSRNIDPSSGVYRRFDVRTYSPIRGLVAGRRALQDEERVVARQPRCRLIACAQTGAYRTAANRERRKTYCCEMFRAHVDLRLASPSLRST